MLKSLITFALLVWVRTLSRLLCNLKSQWIGGEPENYAKGTRVLAVLNHTSLYEPILAGYAPFNLLWKFARHGVLPVAEKTMRRRIGLFFAFLVRHPVVITRQRDHTWDSVLNRVDDKSIVIILPEGRMKRRNGLDSEGREMTIRGGIADILDVLDEGRMLLVYSGGLHHIQAPGELLPRPFRTVRARLEMVDIDDYKREIRDRYPELEFRRAVMADLTRRRDAFCPTDDNWRRDVQVLQRESLPTSEG
jgi:1-acyl-sn-glycerol-3-phosphate acyltransferase